MALLVLVLFAAAFFPVMANDNKTKRNCKDVELWTAMRQSCNRTCSDRCAKNGSIVTIWFKETERGNIHYL